VLTYYQHVWRSVLPLSLGNASLDFLPGGRGGGTALEGAVHGGRLEGGEEVVVHEVEAEEGGGDSA
jgi:hypothetical protein